MPIIIQLIQNNSNTTQDYWILSNTASCQQLINTVYFNAENGTRKKKDPVIVIIIVSSIYIYIYIYTYVYIYIYNYYYHYHYYHYYYYCYEALRPPLPPSRGPSPRPAARGGSRAPLYNNEITNNYNNNNNNNNILITIIIIIIIETCLFLRGLYFL